MQEVIQIESRASAAWSVLAQCYKDMNESQKNLQLRIMAAHLRHDAEEWDRLVRWSKYELLVGDPAVCTSKLSLVNISSSLSNQLDYYRQVESIFFFKE